MHVNNINISHYKMEMDKQDGVVVIMIYIMLLCTVLHHVDQLEVHGVIMYGEIMIMYLLHKNQQLHYQQ